MDIIYRYYLIFLQHFGLPEWLIAIVWYIFPFVVVLGVMFLITGVSFWTECKISSRLFAQKKSKLNECQSNDTEVLSESEDTYNRLLAILAPIMGFVPVVLLFSILPYGNKFIPVSSGVGLFLFFATIMVLACAILLRGIASDNELLANSAIRYTAQILSCSLALVFSSLGSVILASSLNLNDIVLSQSGAIGAIGWYIAPSFIGFVVYFVSTSAIFFHLGERDLFRDLSGMKLLLFSMTKYSGIFGLAVVGVCLFWGGYLPPQGFYLSEIYQFDFVLNNSAVYLEQIMWLVLKTIILIFAIMCFQNSFAGLRTGRIVKFAWKVLVPLAVLNFFIVCIIKPFWGGA